MVKILVYDADGKWRGGLFDDAAWHGDRWTGTPKRGLREDMVWVHHDDDDGSWFLIETVIPQEVVGDEDRGDQFDESSKCCRRTPVQALFWFANQAFGTPPALIDRVRRFLTAWSAFCGSASAQRLLQAVIDRALVDAADEAFAGSAGADLDILRHAELVFVASSGGKDSYFANSIAADMGVHGYVRWMNDHISKVQHLLMHDPAARASRHVPGSTPRPETKSLDDRTAFHQAVVRVLADLRDLASAIQRGPHLQTALLVLDEVSAYHAAPDSGDTDLTASIKHAVGRLRVSLATARRLRDSNPQVASTFWQGSNTDRTWGSINSGSHHDVVLYAADAALEPDVHCELGADRKASDDKPSGIIRRKVLEAAMDQASLQRLADNLQHEYELAGLAELRTSESGPITAAHEPLPPRQDVDWTAIRTSISEQGDSQGLQLVESILACPIEIRPSEDKILDALKNREQVRASMAELQACIDADKTTAAGACTRWQKLANFARKFALPHERPGVANFGGPAGPVSAQRLFPVAAGQPLPPELTWAHAFRESTMSLAQPVITAKLDDAAVHQLTQLIDDLLEGKATEIEPGIRKVDLLVKGVLARCNLDPQTPSRPHPGPSNAGSHVPTLSVSQLPAMILVTLLEQGEMKKSSMKSLPHVRRLDVNNLANLLTPKGDLATRGMIHSKGRLVSLTEAGQQEAEALKRCGATSLARRPNSG